MYLIFSQDGGTQTFREERRYVNWHREGSGWYGFRMCELSFPALLHTITFCDVSYGYPVFWNVLKSTAEMCCVTAVYFMCYIMYCSK